MNPVGLPTSNLHKRAKSRESRPQLSQTDAATKGKGSGTDPPRGYRSFRPSAPRPGFDLGLLLGGVGGLAFLLVEDAAVVHRHDLDGLRDGAVPVVQQAGG